jgi:hypothetical protein
VTRAARIVFALLVLATLGAFVVTQKLKSGPPLVVRPYISTVFSPAPDARVRQARISFWIVHGDDVSVSIVDADGQIVRRLVDGRHLPARKRITRFWNGRTDGGHVAPDGSYRVRVALLGQGRTIDLAQPIVLDTRPPRPRVTDVEPRAGDGPAFLPQRGVHAVTIHVRGTEGRQARVLIYRTDVAPPRRVGELTIPAGRSTTTWDGTLGGRPAPAGTYLMGLLVADRSGNPGTFPARLPPVAGRISTPATHAGVTIRYLAAAPPLTPVPAGRVATVFVDARDHPYQWALRRLGDTKVIAHGHGHGGRLRLRMPRGQSGLIVLTLVSDPTHPDSAEVPIAVRATKPRAVLVVLPAVAWQGLNPVDDDGDGMPNTLAAGTSVQLARPLAPALPPGLRDQEGALLQYLDANLLRYDLTTDAALANDAGPPLAGHRSVVLAGDERWITPRLRTLLRNYVRGGGRVWSLGTDGLRRIVRLRAGVLSAPSAPQPIDALGARPRQPLQQVGGTGSATMTIYQDAPSLGLFASTGGAFSGYDAYESLVPFAAPAKLLSAAGPTAGTPVIAAWQFGAGVAIHTGLPQLAAKAQAGDPDADALVQRIWTLLAQPR